MNFDFDNLMSLIGITVDRPRIAIDQVREEAANYQKENIEPHLNGIPFSFYVETNTLDHYLAGACTVQLTQMII